MVTVGGKPIRIFIIGPMHERPDQTGLPYEVHTSNIKLAAERVIREIEDKAPGQLPFCQVIAPPDQTGDIVRAVFPHIFHCDLAIADISSGSPNVYYELAMLHSLGVPVILLTQGGHKDFYMVRNNVVNLASFEVDEIAVGLRGRGARGQLEQLLLDPVEQHRSNPISDYLNRVPLVHYSAVSGIATGQFFNFIRWILGMGFFKERPNFKSLIFVRPTRIKSMDEDIARLEEVFGDVVPEKDGNPKMKNGRIVRELPTFTHYNPLLPRDKIFIRRIGDHLIDYPTPISSLSYSQQYMDAGDYYKRGSRRIDRASHDAETFAYENSLIDTYIEVLHSYIDMPALDCDATKFEVLTVDEIIARFAPKET